MKCENCQTEITKKYGSGRFCGSKCARGFSTKEKRSLINQKVSQKLKFETYERNCLNCDKFFTTQTKNKKCCSRKCGCIVRSKNPAYLAKLSEAQIKSNIEGKNKITKRSIRCYYNFKNTSIRCDSKTEYACIDYFITKLNAIEIERCNFKLSYEYNNKLRNYIPDFKITTEKGTYIVECKSIFKITEEVKNSKSWSMYYDTIPMKKEILKKYCLDNNFIDFFFTKDLHRYFYDKCNPLK